MARLGVWGMCVLAIMATPVFAQTVKAPIGKAQTDVTAPLQAPSFPKEKTAQSVANAIDDNNLQNLHQSPENEAITQKMRQEWREKDTADTGLKWVPWNQAGDHVHEFVQKRDPELVKNLGQALYLDAAVADIDHDSLPDIILYDWSDCSATACGITVYFDNMTRRPEVFYARKIKPFQKGVMIDDKGYFGF